MKRTSESDGRHLPRHTVIDAHAPRTNQALVGLVASLAVATGQWWLLSVLALQLAAGLTFGRRYCLPCLCYFEVLQPRCGEGPLEDSRPPRSANLTGRRFVSCPLPQQRST